MEVANPYLNKLRELRCLFFDNPSPLTQTQLNQLEEKSRDWTEEKLKEIESTIHIIKVKRQEIKKEIPKITNQYKQAIKLHRLSKELCKEIQVFKKSIIEEMKQRRSK